LIKTCRLNSVLEIYSAAGINTGHFDINALPNHFDWAQGEDMRILKVLASLPSYDVYSLRLAFREHNIEAADPSALVLSMAKMAELTHHMARFTRPLMKRIYGDDVDPNMDLRELLNDPDTKRTMARLKAMAAKLSLSVTDMPRFIEDCTDLFMSLAYYTSCIERVMPVMDAFAGSMTELKQNVAVRNNRDLLADLDHIEQLMRGLAVFVKRTLEALEALADTLWADLVPEKFDQLRTMVHDTQLKVGGVLCTLTVKLATWQQRFPPEKHAQARQRVDFVVGEMNEGLNNIAAMARGGVPARYKRRGPPSVAQRSTAGVSLLSPSNRKPPRH
jgi:hypothetical protein